MNRDLSVNKHMSGKEIESFITDTILTENERLLLPLLFAPPEMTVTKEYCEKISLLTSNLNIDQEHIGYLLMLAILGERTLWTAFPKDVIPRLKGIYRYYLVQNLYGMNWLLAKIRILQAADIPVMLIKGIACAVIMRLESRESCQIMTLQYHGIVSVKL